MTQRTNNKILT